MPNGIYPCKKKNSGATAFGRASELCLYGAGSGGRTRTVSLPQDFESSTSANSIIPAKEQIYCITKPTGCQEFFSSCRAFSVAVNSQSKCNSAI